MCGIISERRGPRPPLLFFRRESELTGDAATGTGGLVAGAAIGGLFLGPLGFLIGANLGGNLGAKAADRKSVERRLRSLGVDGEMVEQARVVGAELDEARLGLDAAGDARDSAARFAETLQRDRDAAQRAAETAVRAGDDAAARTYLSARLSLDTRVEDARAKLSDAVRRSEDIGANLRFLEDRSQEIDEIIARSIVATDQARRGPPDDPLLERFKELDRRD